LSNIILDVATVDAGSANHFVPSWSSYFLQFSDYEKSMIAGFLFGDKPMVFTMFPSTLHDHQERINRLLVRPNLHRRDYKASITAFKWAIRPPGLDHLLQLGQLGDGL
jgi:hypothetical protein